MLTRVMQANILAARLGAQLYPEGVKPDTPGRATVSDGKHETLRPRQPVENFPRRRAQPDPVRRPVLAPSR